MTVLKVVEEINAERMETVIISNAILKIDFNTNS